MGALQAGIFLAVKLCEPKRKPNPNGSILVDYCSPWKARRRDQVLEERDRLGRIKTNLENELQDKKDKIRELKLEVGTLETHLQDVVQELGSPRGTVDQDRSGSRTFAENPVAASPRT